MDDNSWLIAYQTATLKRTLPAHRSMPHVQSVHTQWLGLSDEVNGAAMEKSTELFRTEEPES